MGQSELTRDSWTKGGKRGKGGLQYYQATSLPPPPTRMPRKEKVSRSRNWVFTLNNPNEELVKKTFKTMELNNCFDYLVYQEEEGENKTRHLQGYFVLKKRMELPALKKLLLPLGSPHLEVRKGSHEQAKAYCMKEDTRVVGGMDNEVNPDFHERHEDKGTRNDLLAVKEAIDEGKNELELWEEHFVQMVKYRNSLNYYAILKKPKRSWKTYIKVFYGPTGTGKSRAAFEEAGEDFYNLTPGQTPKGGQLFFEGYRGQENVVFDEFYGSSMGWSQLLALTDRYPATVMVKGSSVVWAPKRMWITSNQHPSQWYLKLHLNCDAQYETLKRRLDSIVYFESLENRYEEKPPTPPSVHLFDDYLKKALENEEHLNGLPESRHTEELGEELDISQEIGQSVPIGSDIFGGNFSTNSSTVNRIL